MAQYKDNNKYFPIELIRRTDRVGKPGVVKCMICKQEITFGSPNRNMAILEFERRGHSHGICKYYRKEDKWKI